MRKVLTVILVLSVLLVGGYSSSAGAGAAPTPDAAAPIATRATGSQQPSRRSYPAKTTPTPVPETAATAQNLKILAQGFGQDGQQLAYAFELENSSAAFAVERSQYQVAAYDEAGTVLASDSGNIELLLPGETLGIAGSMYLDSADLLCDHVEVQIKPGDFAAGEALPGFTVEKATFIKGDYESQVTGVIKSSYRHDVSDLKASALAYDASGEIIGGGYAYISFVLAEGQAPVEIPVITSGEPETVRIYASVSWLSSFRAASPGPRDAENVTLLAQGYGRDEREVAFAFVVENLDADFAVESSQYQVAAYAADGSVLETEEGYIELLLPGQTLGLAGSLYLPDDKLNVDHLDVQVKPGEFMLTGAQPPLTTEMATFIEGDYSSTVTGVIKNPYETDISTVRASAVAYDDRGEIIGGGYTYVGFVPASDQTGVSMMAVTGGDPARVEIYAAVSSLSEFRGASAEDGEALQLVATGFGQDDTQVAYGFVVENGSSTVAVEDSQYRAVAFAEDGTVLNTDEGYIDLLLPGQQLGVAGDMYMPLDDMAVDRVVVQVKTGDATPFAQQPTFTSERVAYREGTYDAKVTGVIKSPYKQDVTNLRVSALAFDDAGAIIGGGYTYVDFVPAEGQTAVEVSVVSSGEPAEVELYAALSGLSEFE